MVFDLKGMDDKGTIVEVKEKPVNAVMAAASSFEAKSRNNSIEGPGNGPKNVRTSSFDAAKTEPQKVQNAPKKEKAIPPPRKSSDPANKVSAPRTSPPQATKDIAASKMSPAQATKTTAVPTPKAESPKLKVSNGTLPHIQNQFQQSSQVQQNIQAIQNVQASQNLVPQNAPVAQNVQTAQTNRVIHASQNVQQQSTNPINIQAHNTHPQQNVQSSQHIQAPQKTQTTAAATPDTIKTKEEPQKIDAAAESNGVGDKIRKFERAAEDATAGRTSRPGSVRGRVRNDVHEKNSTPGTSPPIPEADKKQGSVEEKQNQVFSPTAFSKWRKEDPQTPIPAPKSVQRVEDKETRPTIKFNKFPTDLPVKSSARTYVDRPQPSVQAQPDATPPNQLSHIHRRKETEEENTQFKTCSKFKPKDRYSGKPSGYFTRGTEEIWLVKKKDIEEIEDRVMESFRRAGGSCRSEPIREFPSFTVGSATLGRNKRATYGRSESLDPQHAASRSQTLKRQSSVACTCGHDKKGVRSKSSGGSTPVDCATTRPRSRSHGDDHSQAHVLDKYETLV